MLLLSALRAATLLALSLGLSPSTAAVSQDYPAREITLIVPFPRAGVTDMNARILATHPARLWKQNIAIINMPGGGGTTGTMYVLGAAQDGYTMLMSATGQATQNPAIDSKLPYK